MLIGQISDTHIKADGKFAYRVVDTAGALRRCVAEILRLPQQPDVLLFTGDIVDNGQADEYALVRELLAPLGMPVYLSPGNHDSRDQMRLSFPDHAYLQQPGEFIQYAVEDYPVRILALDTMIPGKSGGALCEKRLRWLDEALRKAPDRPTVVTMHHPPFATGLSHMDTIGLTSGAQALGAIVQRHPQVERLLCGHLHRSIVRRFHGTVASTCPSPAHQAALDFAPGVPPSFMMEPPGFQLHLWSDRLGLVSHTASIGNFEGPYPYFEGGKRID
jgi:Icc protein